MTTGDIEDTDQKTVEERVADLEVVVDRLVNIIDAIVSAQKAREAFGKLAKARLKKESDEQVLPVSTDEHP